ncbi:MAG: plastocyanin/azurin family copper-binding protein [Actinomycetota bacterium]
MSRKMTRLVLAASVAAGFTVAPMLSAYAADRNVFAKDQAFSGNIEDGKPTTDAAPGDSVFWRIENGEHTVTPKSDEPGYSVWPEAPASGTLKSGDSYKVTFPKAGRYFFFCEKHAGMVGVVDVKDQNPATTSSTTTTTTAPPTTTTTRAVIPGPTTTTTSAPASSAGAKPPVTAAPAPTTTTAKDKKNKDDKGKKEEETTTTTVPPPPPPVDLPDSAIVPGFPGFDSTPTTTQNGIEQPASTPEGDAIALLKPEKGNGGRAMKLLIVSGLGLGALGIGTAGYKYANRSSKYFPA